MYTLLHCNIFSLKCPTTHWNRAPKFKSAFFTSSNLWKLSYGFVLRLYHISFNVNLASQATKQFTQSCGAKYFSQQSPFIFLAQKSLYLANTFLGPAPRGVAALVSVSDDKIQITILILRPGAFFLPGPTCCDAAPFHIKSHLLDAEFFVIRSSDFTQRSAIFPLQCIFVRRCTSRLRGTGDLMVEMVEMLEIWW